MTDNKMNFEDFCSYVSEHIKEYLPEEYQNYDVIAVNRKDLNAELVLSGITLREPGSVRPEPIMNLERTYHDYLNYQGYDMNCALKSISESYLAVLQSEQYQMMPEYTDLFRNPGAETWDKVKDFIVICAVPVCGNEEELQFLPHKQQGDIAGVYKFSFNINEEERFCIQINDMIADRLGVGLEELHQAAISNCVKSVPAECVSLQEMISNLLPDIPTDQLLGEEEIKIPLNVLTNSQKYEGAAVIFYPGMLEMIADDMPQGFYVLPSSKHEVMICPKSEGVNLEELNEMVREINRTQVAPEDRLSDFVHEYDPVTKQLRIASEEKELVIDQEPKCSVR
jgi:hypothetical protein